jgi:hypothetical protein
MNLPATTIWPVWGWLVAGGVAKLKIFNFSFSLKKINF